MSSDESETPGVGIVGSAGHESCSAPQRQRSQGTVLRRGRSKLEQSIVFHVPPFNASDVFYPSYATSSSSDSDQEAGPDRRVRPLRVVGASAVPSACKRLQVA